MELLTPSEPKELFSPWREIVYPPITLQKDALYVEKRSVCPVVGALHDRNGFLLQRSGTPTPRSHPKHTWPARVKCTNQNTPSNSRRAYPHKLLLHKRRRVCHKGLAEEPWLIELPSPFRWTRYPQPSLNAALHHVFPLKGRSFSDSACLHLMPCCNCLLNAVSEGKASITESLTSPPAAPPAL